MQVYSSMNYKFGVKSKIDKQWIQPEVIANLHVDHCHKVLSFLGKINVSCIQQEKQKHDPHPWRQANRSFSAWAPLPNASRPSACMIMFWLAIFWGEQASSCFLLTDVYIWQGSSFNGEKMQSSEKRPKLAPAVGATQFEITQSELHTIATPSNNALQKATSLTTTFW